MMAITVNHAIRPTPMSPSCQDDGAKSLLDTVELWKRKGEERLPSVLCVICGMSNAAYRRPDGVYVVPITALRP